MACARVRADPTLRHEVGSLLAQPPAGLIDRPFGALVDGLAAPPRRGSRPVRRSARIASNAARRRRDGRGVSRARHAARSRRRDQDPAGRVRGRRRSARAVRARSASPRLAESSEHRRHLRVRGCRRRHGARHGARRGRRRSPSGSRAEPLPLDEALRSRGRSPTPSKRRTSRASSIAI